MQSTPSNIKINSLAFRNDLILMKLQRCYSRFNLFIVSDIVGIDETKCGAAGKNLTRELFD